MSYGIIFQTIIIKYGNRVLWFDRSGCNNDDCGRKEDDFILKVFNSSYEYINYFSKWLGNNKDAGKLNGKWITLDQYAKYYIKKLKNALSIEEFNNKYYSYFLKNIHVDIEGEKIKFEDFNYWEEFKKRGGCFSYKIIRKEITLDELVENNKNVIIDIRKRNRK